jgi:hypothetical protein
MLELYGTVCHKLTTIVFCLDNIDALPNLLSPKPQQDERVHCKQTKSEKFLFFCFIPWS